MWDLSAVARSVLNDGDLVERLVERAWENEGGTFGLAGEELPYPAELIGGRPRELWAVGRRLQGMTLAPEVVSTDIVKAWAEAVVDLDPNHDSYGVWFNRDENRVHFDAVDLYGDAAEALTQARARGELAVYDIVNDVERKV